MTGTGTQADPYIPTTLTEFIEAVGTSGAYVALDRDIDAASDPAYTGELASSIAWRAVEVDGGGFSLVGVTVALATFFVTSAATTAKNFRIRDCTLKKGTTDCIIWDGISGTMTHQNCIISIKVDCEVGSTSYLSYNVIFDTCAIMIQYTGTSKPPSGSRDSIFDGTDFIRSTVLIDSLSTQITTMILFRRGTASRTAFILKDTSFSTMRLAEDATFEYGYVCFIGSLSYGAITAFQRAVTCLVSCEQEASVSLASGWTQCSIDQLKDKDYLSSVGWLP